MNRNEQPLERPLAPFTTPIDGSLYRVYNHVDNIWVAMHSGALKIKIFNAKFFYNPSKWPGLKNELPSRTKFRKLSKRQQRIVAKRIEKYIMDVEASYVKLPE